VGPSPLQVKQVELQKKQEPSRRYSPGLQEVQSVAPGPLHVKQEGSQGPQMPEFAGFIVVPEPQPHTLPSKG